MKLFLLIRPEGPWPAGSGRTVLPRLAQKLDWGPVTYSSRGKPLIGQGYCSITHAKEWLLIAWERFPVGLDLESERPVSEALIRRLNLDPEDPLSDWCRREARIKLEDNPQHLFEPLTPDLCALRIEIKAGYRCYALAHRPLVLESLEILDIDAF